MFFRDLDGWREKHTLMNESANFLIETCDESVVVELEKSLLTTNRRWKEICDSVRHFMQVHTSEQRAKEHEQGEGQSYAMLCAVLRSRSVTIGMVSRHTEAGHLAAELSSNTQVSCRGYGGGNEVPDRASHRKLRIILVIGYLIAF